MSTLYDTVVYYIRKYHNENNSNVTLEKFSICDNQRRGVLELKWWKEKGILIIRNIQLDTPKNEGNKNLIMKLIKGLGENQEIIQKGLSRIRLETVTNETLYEKFRDKGWSCMDGALDIYV